MVALAASLLFVVNAVGSSTSSSISFTATPRADGVKSRWTWDALYTLCPRQVPRFTVAVDGAHKQRRVKAWRPSTAHTAWKSNVKAADGEGLSRQENATELSRRIRREGQFRKFDWPLFLEVARDLLLGEWI